MLLRLSDLYYVFKINLRLFFDLENIKKPPRKVAYLRQLVLLGVFFLWSPDCLNQPRSSFPFYKFFYTIVSAKVSGYTIHYCWSIRKSLHVLTEKVAKGCSHYIFNLLWQFLSFNILKYWRRIWEGNAAFRHFHKFNGH